MLMSPTRIKKYTGCWTCRTRAIRCDEQKPDCYNCKCAGVECEGYKVKLCWQNNLQGKPQFDRTRCLVLEEWEERDLLDDSQIDSFLSRIDWASRSITAKDNDYRYGPFKVFSVGKPIKQTGHSAVKEKLKCMSSTVSQVGVDTESWLFEFWDRSLCKFMVPVSDDVINPYRMVTQTILDHSIPFEVRNAVLHSVYATCSSFLDVSKEFIQLDSDHQHINFNEHWNLHRKKAMEFLSICYMRKETYLPRELGLLAASMLFLLTIDIFYNTKEWQIHFRGALSMLQTMKKLGNGDQNLDPSVYFAQLTKLTYLFSTLYVYDDDVCNKYISVVDLDCIQFSTDQEMQSLIYRNLGVTESMITCLAEVVKYLQLGETVKTIDAIQMDIDACEPGKMREYFDSQNGLIVHNQSMIFHTAMRLLFEREAKKQSPFELQDIVNTGVYHLKIDHEITNEFDGVGLLWPVFVIACEATSGEAQRVLQIYLESFQLYTGTSLERAIHIIFAVWERRKHDNNVSWISVVRELDPTILLS